MISGPAVRVERRVAEVLHQVAVELLPSALRNKADLPGGGASILGTVVRGQDLDFLDRIHVLCAEHRAGRARPGGDGAVYHDKVFVGASAVDAETPVGHTVRVERSDGSAAHAGLQQGKVDRVASVQRQIRNLFRINRAADHGRFGLDQAGRRLHLHGFGYGSDSQLEVDADANQPNLA